MGPGGTIDAGQHIVSVIAEVFTAVNRDRQVRPAPLFGSLHKLQGTASKAESPETTVGSPSSRMSDGEHPLKRARTSSTDRTGQAQPSSHVPLDGFGEPLAGRGKKSEAQAEKADAPDARQQLPSGKGGGGAPVDLTLAAEQPGAPSASEKGKAADHAAAGGDRPAHAGRDSPDDRRGEGAGAGEGEGAARPLVIDRKAALEQCGGEEEFMVELLGDLRDEVK